MNRIIVIGYRHYAEDEVSAPTHVFLLGDDQTRCNHTLYQFDRFDDGQMNFEPLTLKNDRFNPKVPVEIVCSIAYFDQLQVISTLIAGLRRSGFYISRVVFNYLFGMRSDRFFYNSSDDETFPICFFEDVVAPVINAWKCHVAFFCPHSEKALSTLNHGPNLTAIYQNSKHDPFSSNAAFSKPYKDFENINGHISIAADESELERGYYNRSAQGSSFISYLMQMEGPFDGHFIKKRVNGEIDIKLAKGCYEHIKAHAEHDPEKPIVISDDMCDGGRTFIQECVFFRQFMQLKNPLILAVAHPLFLHRHHEVLDFFDRIITTNSLLTYPNSTSHYQLGNQLSIKNFAPGSVGINHDQLAKLEIIDVWGFPGFSYLEGYSTYKVWEAV